jgi:hypothetical protein
LALFLESGVGVDPHGHVERGVPDDAHDDVRRHAEVKQQRDAAMPEVVKPHGR